MLRKALADLETRISETQSKRDLIIAKKNRARTQETMQKTMQGIGNAGAVDKLDRLEERIDSRLAKAEAMTELESGSLDSQFRNLEADSAVDSELEELKRQLGMGSGGSSSSGSGSKLEG